MGSIKKKNLDLIYDDANAYHIALQAQIYSLLETMEAHDALCTLVQRLREGSRLKLICEICFLYLNVPIVKSSILSNLIPAFLKPATMLESNHPQAL